MQLDMLGGKAASDGLGNRALTFSIEIRGLTRMTELADTLRDAVLPLGMTAAASGLVSGPKASSLSPFHFTNWSDAWIKHYMSHDYLLIDPVPRWARNSGVPITFGDLIGRLSPRDVGHEVIGAAARFGYTEGMVVPMRSGDNSLGLVAFAGNRGPVTLAEQSCLTSIGRAVFEAAERIEHDGDIGRVAPILSAREIECLTLLTRGHTDNQIGKLLGLSASTVRFHLGNARDKSGAVSRTHLAALAVAQGYVTF